MDLYQTSIENLQALTLNINDKFFTYELKDIPLLEGMNNLLSSINEKGLKLTQKGFLPTKVVKSVVEVASTTADERFLKYLQEDFIFILTERFDEEFAMDVGSLMLLLEQLQKDAKTLKKNKPDFIQGVKEFIQSYFMIVLELRSRSF